MSLPPQTKIFTGTGQSGDWSDPLNWAGGHMPGANNLALIPTDATLNGSFAVHQLMMLGHEAVTINGVLGTTSLNRCTAFMVCANAVATFTPTSTLDDAGGLIVGNISTGTLIAQGNATTHATLNSDTAALGKAADGVGTVTIDGARWNDTLYLYVGQLGQGTLNVQDDGVVNVGTGLTVGVAASASGTVALSSGGDLNVAGNAMIGSSMYKTATDGVGRVSVGAGSALTAGGAVVLSGHGALGLAGGTVSTADTTLGVQVAAGGKISGFGTVNSTGVGIYDRGVIEASGGTLVLNGAVNGTGVVQIDANSTLRLTAETIGGVHIAFLGAGASLALPGEFADHAMITGFGSGDSIVLAGAADALSWNSHGDVLSVSSAGEVVDTLKFSGSFAANPFSLSHTDAGSVITLSNHS